MELLDRIRRTFGLFPDHSYGPLDPNIDDLSAHDDSPSGGKAGEERKTACLLGKLLAIVLVISIAAGAIVALTATSTRNGFAGSDWITCGYTPEEATSRDCVFDIMMNGWIPRQCYNQTLSERYIKEHKEFRFYADRLGLEQLSLEELQKGQHPRVFTTKNHHYAHCAFVWELQGFALAGGQYVDEHSMNSEREFIRDAESSLLKFRVLISDTREDTTHCAGLLLRSHQITDEPNVGNGSRVPQIVEIGYMRCRAMW
ncbi:hypothetical protein LTR85_001023 [Meristemomyces frigidus]|nr:hypothetical protein LTR85_001023 [Meristemomyces frigidus]